MPLPVDEDLVGAGDPAVAEHVRVAMDQLGHDPLGHVVDVPPALLRRDLRVERHLQQQVAELVADRVVVAAVDGVEQLVRLLQEVPGQRRCVCSRSHGHPPGARARLDADQIEQPFPTLRTTEPAPRDAAAARPRGDAAGAAGSPSRPGRALVTRHDLQRLRSSRPKRGFTSIFPSAITLRS